MSSRRSIAPSRPEQPSSADNSSEGGNENQASGARKKTKSSGTVVKSRYRQPVVEKSSLPKSNSLTNEFVLPPRPSSPKPAGGVRSSSPKPAGGVRPSSPKPAGSVRPSSPKPAGGVRPSSPKPAGGVRPSSPKPAGGVRPSSPKPAGGVRPSSPKPAGGVRPSSPKPAGGVRPSSSKPAGGVRPSSSKPAGGVRPSSPKPAGSVRPSSPKPAGSVRSSSPKPAGGVRPSSPKPAGGVRPRVATPPRRSMAPRSTSMSSLLEPARLGRSVLQSTFSDGHYAAHPEFDLSVIREKTLMERERGSEEDKMIIDNEAFLLAYLTAKMQHNTAKFKAAAEASLLQMMEEEEKLRRENQEKRRQYLLMEQDKRTKELLELQISVLTPVAEAAERFTEEYQTLATAVDATRHELPVKHLYIQGDGRTFLAEAEARLKETEAVLLQSSQSSQLDHSSSAEHLRDMKTTSKDISQQLAGGFSELLELSSLVSYQNILTQQALEEDGMGFTRAQELYRPAR